MSYKEDYMRVAIDLAKLGEGYVSPNPLVGAVIVKNGKIIGRGYHQKYGDCHAEVNAFKNCEESAEGAEMYVTLEPCAHYGKQPPCALAIVEKGVKKVYVGMTDPNPLVAGKGIEILKNAGIEVETGILENECKALNPVFLKYITTGLPYVVMKTAVTLDGKIAAKTGDSKWVSSEESRNDVQKLRHRLRGIMVGINTVLADNPRLTCRLENGRDPIRIIADSTLKIPLDANVLADNNVIIATTKNADKDKLQKLRDKGITVLEISDCDGRINLKELMEELGKTKIDGILLEGGGTLNFSALQSGIVDEIITYIAPKIIGGKDAKTSVEGDGLDIMNSAFEFDFVNTETIGCDIKITARKNS
jgi:diaminohydroxyphosphoribosylaminopyrimidine deaminase/5-amino-6-(5-phosphoribosylamino)uracil reductase